MRMAENGASHFDLAVLGADDPLGESVLRLLEEREIAVGNLYPLTLNDSDTTVVFAGQDWPCLPAEHFDFSQTQALLVTSKSAAAEQLVARVVAAHTALPVARVAETAAREPAAAVVVARLLAVVDAVAGIRSAEAMLALPVADAGKAGVDELSEQTRGLFNLDSPDAEVFPAQIAFNLMPLPDADYDARLVEATCRLLGKSIDLGFSGLLAPLFYGAAVVLHVRTERTPDPDKLRQACRHAEGLLLMESDLPIGIPTPATDAADSDDVFIGRIQIGRASCRERV